MTLIFSFLAYENGLYFGSLYASLAVAFATATIVDFAYNYIVMKGMVEMVAGYLMLNSDVQKEIMKPDKIEEILSIALDNTVGPKLSEALRKSIIYEIAAARELYLMDKAYLSVRLDNSDNPQIQRSFFKVTMISRFNMVLVNNKAIFYATNDSDLFDKLLRITPDAYFVFRLPNIEKELLENNFTISELSINDEIIPVCKIETPKLGDSNGFVIKTEFEIPKNIFNNIGETVNVTYKLESIISKHKHYVFRSIPRAYPSFHMTWDCTNTNIKNVDVLCSFLGTQPKIINHTSDGRKIDILVDDWVLPNNMIVLIWKLQEEDEIG